ATLGSPPVASLASRSARVPRRSRWAASSGWLAAAACLLLAVAGWYRSPSSVVIAPVAQLPPVAPIAPVAPQAPAPSLTEQRAALLTKQGSIQIPLGATKDPAAAGVVGDVVWDPATQTGFMRFVGLAANDPKVRQYQIWIFDGSRDKRYPVDGGIFDVPAEAGEIVVPIRAGVPVRVAAAFAVTVEKPGGVVVSSRAHVVVLGAKS
ncbi:MAG: anti-sigma factor, partial [Pseudomonadota bacterium]|nr:anti-sigma factor [Pseudomonadota bacterium]